MSKGLLIVFVVLFLNCAMFSQHMDEVTFDSIAIEKHVLLTDRYVFELGLFSNSKSVVMNVDGNLPNKPIDFGETLGMSRRGNTIDINFTWRFSQQMKWFVTLNYFAVRNDQSVVLEEDFRWGNTIYPVGVQINTAFDVDMFRLFFGRVISMGDKHELSAGLGIHNMNIRTYAQARAYLGGTDLELDLTKKDINVLAPIPNIGVRYLYAPSTRWAFSANLEWFSLQVGDYKGILWDISPTVSYQLFDNFGLGFSYKYFKAQFDMNRNVWKGSANLLYQGPLISVSLSF